MHVMSATLQIRNVPEEVHAAVRTHAAKAGLSVSDYLLNLVSELVTRPTMAEVVQRARELAQTGSGVTRAEARAAVREGRDR